MVLNEKEYAIEVLKTMNMTESVSSTLFILAKYFYYIEKKSEDEILVSLDEFMRRAFEDYNKVAWIPLFERAIKSAVKYPLVEISFIPVTKAELDKIGYLKSIQEQRVMFAMLCYAKYYNLLHRENNGWVNTDAKEIFNSSHVQKNVESQYMMLHKLSNKGFIAISKSIETLNKQVLIINDDSPILLKIKDFRDLGYEYMLYKGEDYIRCEECSRLTKNNKNGTKRYCNPCTKYKTIDTKAVVCIDCGSTFYALSKNTKSERCCTCYEEHRRLYLMQKAKERREKQRIQTNFEMSGLQLPYFQGFPAMR